MKVNELMIGDWVLDKKTNRPYKIIGTNDLLFYNDYSPILLTAEILEKIGFDVSDKEVMQYHFEEDGEKYHFSLRQMYDKDGTPHGYSFYAFNVLTIIDYVHQLQHALRLCNIEKEIEL